MKSSIADQLGLIQRINVKEDIYDFAFSYNRFLNSNIDYVIYLENPLALVHYSTKRNRTFISKIKLKTYFNDPKLKAIICLSKACYDTINNFYSIPKKVRVEQIYPYVPKNSLIDIEIIKEKCNRHEIQCLYISSNFYLKGGGDILEVFKKLKDYGVNNIKLNIITQIELLNEIDRIKISSNPNIKLYRFKFNKDELYEFYNNSCIFLIPTRQDSFSLVVLEAMKSGNLIITTDLYALTEMVDDNYNGYLTVPRYRFFNYNNMPNEYVWNNRKNTIYSNYVDNKIVDFLIKKIIYLNKNRNILQKMALNSYKKATIGEFSEDFILKKWDEIFR